MKHFSHKDIKGLEKFNTNIQMRIPIIVSYLLLILILREGFDIPFPFIVFFIVSFMMLSSLALAFYFDRFPLRSETILNVYFFYTIFDLFFLTIIIYYIGGITWLGFIIYSYYLILNFMTFSRAQALFLTAWMIFMYLLFISFQYLQIFPSFSLFSPGTQTPFNFPYVLTTAVIFSSTFILVAYYSLGYYQLYASKISDLQKTKEILEEERASLEARVESRKKELEKEREGLEERIKERKKELEKEEMVLREKGEELEKFQKIALGREEKLKELESELAKLKKKYSSVRGT